MDNVFVAASGTTAFGNYAIDAAGAWTYTLDDTNDTVEVLNLGDTLPDSFVVASEDGSTQTISITINAASDGPTPFADLLFGSAGNDTLDGGIGFDILYGQGGDDFIFGGAGYFSDTLYGGNGNDTLEDGNGLNLLAGEAGDNLLTGNSSLDTLEGGFGMDTLIAGDSADIVDGVANCDTFVFGLESGDDTIANFQNWHDKMDISALGVTCFADLVTAGAITASGSSTVIDLNFVGGDGTILLEDSDIARIDVTNFLF